MQFSHFLRPVAEQEGEWVFVCQTAAEITDARALFVVLQNALTLLPPGTPAPYRLSTRREEDAPAPGPEDNVFVIDYTLPSLPVAP